MSHRNPAIPLIEAAEFFLALKTASAPVADPDTTGELEGRFRSTVAEVLQTFRSSARSKLRLATAYRVYSEELRSVGNTSLGEHFKDHSMQLLDDVDFFVRRSTVLGGPVELGEIDTPPPQTELEGILKTLIRLEQENIAILRNAVKSTGNNPSRYAIEHMLAEDQHHLDDLWQHLPQESRHAVLREDHPHPEHKLAGKFTDALKAKTLRQGVKDLGTARKAEAARKNTPPAVASLLKDLNLERTADPRGDAKKKIVQGIKSTGKAYGALALGAGVVGGIAHDEHTRRRKSEALGKELRKKASEHDEDLRQAAGSRWAPYAAIAPSLTATGATLGGLVGLLADRHGSRTAVRGVQIGGALGAAAGVYAGHSLSQSMDKALREAEAGKNVPDFGIAGPTVGYGALGLLSARHLPLSTALAVSGVSAVGGAALGDRRAAIARISRRAKAELKRAPAMVKENGGLPGLSGPAAGVNPTPPPPTPLMGPATGQHQKMAELEGSDWARSPEGLTMSLNFNRAIEKDLGGRKAEGARRGTQIGSGIGALAGALGTLRYGKGRGGILGLAAGTGLGSLAGAGAGHLIGGRAALPGWEHNVLDTVQSQNKEILRQMAEHVDRTKKAAANPPSIPYATRDGYARECWTDATGQSKREQERVKNAAPKAELQKLKGLKRVGQLLTGSRAKKLEKAMGDRRPSIARRAGDHESLWRRTAPGARGDNSILTDRLKKVQGKAQAHGALKDMAAKEKGKVQNARAGAALVAAGGGGVILVREHRRRQKEKTAAEKSDADQAETGRQRAIANLASGFTSDKHSRGERYGDLAGRLAGTAGGGAAGFKASKGGTLPVRVAATLGGAALGDHLGGRVGKTLGSERDQKKFWKDHKTATVAHEDNDMNYNALNRAFIKAAAKSGVKVPPEAIAEAEAAQQDEMAQYAAQEQEAAAAQEQGEANYYREQYQAAAQELEQLRGTAEQQGQELEQVQMELQQTHEQNAMQLQQADQAIDQARQMAEQASSTSLQRSQQLMAQTALAANVRNDSQMMKEQLVNMSAQPSPPATLNEAAAGQGGDPSLATGAPPGQDPNAMGAPPGQDPAAAQAAPPQEAAPQQAAPKKPEAKAKTAMPVGLTGGLIGAGIGGLGSLAETQAGAGAPLLRRAVERLKQREGQGEGGFATSLALAKANYELEKSQVAKKNPAQAALVGALLGAGAGSGVEMAVRGFRGLRGT